MTKTSKATKIAAMILTLAMLCSMFCIIGSATAGAAWASAASVAEAAVSGAA